MDITTVVELESNSRKEAIEGTAKDGAIGVTAQEQEQPATTQADNAGLQLNELQGHGQQEQELQQEQQQQQQHIQQEQEQQQQQNGQSMYDQENQHIEDSHICSILYFTLQYLVFSLHLPSLKK